jgi:hypothetical protein
MVLKVGLIIVKYLVSLERLLIIEDNKVIIDSNSRYKLVHADMFLIVLYCSYILTG